MSNSYLSNTAKYIYCQNQLINSQLTFIRKNFKTLKNIVHISRDKQRISKQKSHDSAKEDPMELNFKGFENLRSKTPADRAQREIRKMGLFVQFTTGVMITKMSGVAHFFYFLLMTATDQSQFEKNI